MDLSRLREDERGIVGRLLAKAGNKGFLVSVFDGDRAHPIASKNYKKVARRIGVTDETTLFFYDADQPFTNGLPKLVGWVYLAHGEGENVIANWSNTAEIGSLLAKAER